jgi:hypothetical protein
VRREQFIARKKKERSAVVCKSDSDMKDSKWFSNLGSWFSKKNKSQASTHYHDGVRVRGGLVF